MDYSFVVEVEDSQVGVRDNLVDHHILVDYNRKDYREVYMMNQLQWVEHILVAAVYYKQEYCRQTSLQVSVLMLSGRSCPRESHGRSHDCHMTVLKPVSIP